MSVTKRLIRVAVGIGLAFALLPGAKASPIYYDFSVTATSGPLIGSIASGTFSYDSSSIVLRGNNNSAGLLTALNFTWDGILYTQATANTGWLSFDSGGNLIGECFGNLYFPGTCGVDRGQEQWLVSSQFVYYAVSSPGFGLGTVSVTPSVAEPSTMVLLSAGLGGLAVAAFRRRSAGLAIPPGTEPHSQKQNVLLRPRK
jgi:hypothetical protein